MASVSLSGGRGVLKRPSATTGFWSWLTTVDHKKIGILYGLTSFVFFIVGGCEALLIRSQLAKRVSIYTMPELRFAYDESVERGDHLSRLIDSVIPRK